MPTLTSKSLPTTLYPMAIAESNSNAIENRPQPLEPSNTREHGWLQLIRREIYANPKVEALYIRFQEHRPAIDYWIIIQTRDVALVKEIAQSQRSRILNLFAEDSSPFVLDFHICYQENRPFDEVVPSGAIFVPKF